MSLAAINRRDHILAAIAECDRLGRTGFLERYGFQKALRYVVRHKGKDYDSKAIVGVAHAFATPERRALRPRDFTGGQASVGALLLRLGFRVLDLSSAASAPYALVLVASEAASGGPYGGWDDQLGERFHFPNMYTNLVREGLPFVYIRGKKRADGTIGEAEYFGSGRIGFRWPDPANAAKATKSTHAWYCALEDYTPFAVPVRARNGRDGRFETITNPMGWRNGVRALSRDQFLGILSESGLPATLREQPSESADAVQLPDLETVVFRDDPNSSVLLAHRYGEPSSRTPGRTRRSAHAKVTGDRGEEVALEYLRRTLSADESASLRWVAAEGAFPGWDIEYVRADGARVAVEVKSTSGNACAEVTLTDNEWAAAARERGLYHLLIIGGCLGSSVRVDLIVDPWGLAEAGTLVSVPSTWSLRRAAVAI